MPRARWVSLLALLRAADADEIGTKPARTAASALRAISAAEPGAATVVTLSSAYSSLAKPLNGLVLADTLLKLGIKGPLAQLTINVGLQMKLPLTAECLTLSRWEPAASGSQSGAFPRNGALVLYISR